VKNKILVVGTGPSGLASVSELVKDKNLEIILIDNANLNDKKNIDNDECIFKYTFEYGNRISSENLVIDNKHKLFFNKELPDVSKSFGGFSNVWGGTISEGRKKNIEAFKSLGIKLDQFYKEIDNEFFQSTEKIKNEIPNFLEDDFLNSTIEKSNTLNKDIIIAKYSNIALNKSLNINQLKSEQKCKFCKSYLWYCSTQSIWSSKKSMLDIINKENISYLKDTKIKKFYENKGIVKCWLESNDETKEVEFDKVLLAPGAIPTSEIMLSSGYVEKVVIQNTDLISIPIFKFLNFKKSNTSLAHIFFYNLKGDYDFFGQFYNYSRGLLHLGKDAVPILKFVKKLPDLFFSYLGGLFLYIDPLLSSKLMMSFNREKKEIIYKKIDMQDKVEFNFYIRNFLKYMKKINLFPIFLMKKTYKYGTSNHYGAQFPHSEVSSVDKTDKLGRLGNLKNVFIVDSSVLPEINTGPLTYTIMANSRRITKLIMDNEL